MDKKDKKPNWDRKNSRSAEAPSSQEENGEWQKAEADVQFGDWALGTMNDARRRRLGLQKRILENPKMTHEKLADLVEEVFNPKARVFVFLDGSEIIIADAPLDHIVTTVKRSGQDGLWLSDGYCVTYVPPQAIKRIGIFSKNKD